MTMKRVAHSKLKILSLVAQPHVVPTLCNFLVAGYSNCSFLGLRILEKHKTKATESSFHNISDPKRDILWLGFVQTHTLSLYSLTLNNMVRIESVRVNWFYWLVTVRPFWEARDSCASCVQVLAIYFQSLAALWERALLRPHMSSPHGMYSMPYKPCQSYMCVLGIVFTEF